MPQDWKKSVEEEDAKRKKKQMAVADSAAAKMTLERRQPYMESMKVAGESTGLEYEPRVTPRQARRWGKK